MVNENGSFTKKTPEAILALETAASLDATVAELCLMAKISHQTYYTWINEDKKLKERLDTLRNKPVLKARKIVIDKMEESYSNAMDYLSRKRKKEFSTRQELTGEDGKDLNGDTKEVITKLDSILDKID